METEREVSLRVGMKPDSSKESTDQSVGESTEDYSLRVWIRSTKMKEVFDHHVDLKRREEERKKSEPRRD